MPRWAKLELGWSHLMVRPVAIRVRVVLLVSAAKALSVDGTPEYVAQPSLSRLPPQHGTAVVLGRTRDVTTSPTVARDIAVQISSSSPRATILPAAWTSMSTMSITGR